MHALYYGRMSHQGGLMERLTEKIKDVIVYTKGDYDNTLAVEMKTSDVAIVLKRLCEYEDTRLTPTQINNMKKIRQHGKGQRKKIVGVPKSGAKVIISRVSEHGIVIDGILYDIPILVKHHFGEKVKIIIIDDIATVFDLDNNEQIIWFELNIQKHVNCKHTYHPIFNE